MTDDELTVAIDVRFIDHPGIGRYVENLLRHLPLMISVLAIGNPDYRAETLKARPSATWVETDAPTFSIREQLVLPAILHRRNVDVYHSPQFLLPLLWTGPTVATIHDCAYDRYPSEFGDRGRVARWYYSAMMRHAVAGADRIIAVSTQTVDDLRQYYGGDCDTIDVIHHGVSAGSVPSERPQSVPGGEYFLHVGTARPRKNLDRLLASYATAVDQYDACPDLVLAGQHDTRFLDVNSRVTKLGVASRVKELGFVDQDTLWALYGEATALVFPSLYEGFGFPVLEAMSVGTPVITSDQSALREVAGDAALLVDPEDIDAIADAMITVATDSLLRERLATDGLRRAASFDWNETATRTANVYRSALD